MDKQSIYIIYGNSPAAMIPELMKHAVYSKDLKDLSV